MRVWRRVWFGGKVIRSISFDAFISHLIDPPVHTPTIEPKKEQRFSKDGHFYTGAIGIGTYSWGDRRDGFFYGDVRAWVRRGWGGLVDVIRDS